MGPSPCLAPLPQILISPASLHTNQADHHKAIERVRGRMGGKYNSLHKQDKPSLLVQDHDSPKVFYEGQMLSTPKLLRIASIMCVGGRAGNNQHPYILTRLPGNVFILFSNQDLPQARRSTPNEQAKPNPLSTEKKSISNIKDLKSKWMLEEHDSWAAHCFWVQFYPRSRRS